MREKTKKERERDRDLIVSSYPKRKLSSLYIYAFAKYKNKDIKRDKEISIKNERENKVGERLRFNCLKLPIGSYLRYAFMHL